MGSIVEIVMTKDDFFLIVNEAMRLGRQQARFAQKDTKRRLEKEQVLRERLAGNLELLEEYKEFGPRAKRSVIRFSSSGSRLSKDDILDGLIRQTESEIAYDEEELEKIKDMKEAVSADEFFPVIEGRYTKRLTDEQIAEELHRDPRTIQRHRQRLIEDMAIWLHGEIAL